MSIIPKCPICWGRCGPGQCETKQQPEALRLADALTTLTGTQKDKHTTAKQAADELRRLYWEALRVREHRDQMCAEVTRLHAENEALRGMSFDTKRDMETETLLRQVLEALESAVTYHGVMLLSDPPQDAWKFHGVERKANAAIAALKERLK